MSTSGKACLVLVVIVYCFVGLCLNVTKPTFFVSVRRLIVNADFPIDCAAKLWAMS